MSAKKQIWVLVGGNGAGKSTFYKLYLERLGLPFVNADMLAQMAYPDSPEAHSYDAAMLAEQMRTNLLLGGASFCFETVYSHPSKIDFVAHAKALGYEVIMVMIHLQCVELNQARVAERVSEGGHSVPEEKVSSRIPRTLQHVKASIPLCDRIQIYDNSFEDDPFKPVLALNNGSLVRYINPLPGWAEELLTDHNL
ncbi:MAG: zeta toxin family protein [Candidatus Thiodiazotropha sp. (ex Lucinoma kastoroae)]|nr:zeta toxin family protein [Candidatus Thiodiazotropha sp. (ex Rostrolucina anterorostrata)]MCU7847999.1 zeta toxin family protein [Candidatus Thiodiazotropha sp. (ex Lucinoma kastoroae)]MCU7860178.1 zeta toxin family protein [Candidatus Thiodiazotropha sp. (ex Lucinoma kastoroae)]